MKKIYLMRSYLLTLFLMTFCSSLLRGSVEGPYYEGSKLNASFNVGTMPFFYKFNMDYNYKSSSAFGPYCGLALNLEQGSNASSFPLVPVIMGGQYTYAFNGHYNKSGFRTKVYAGSFLRFPLPHLGALLSYRVAYSKKSFLDCGLGAQFLLKDFLPDIEFSFGRNF